MISIRRENDENFLKVLKVSTMANIPIHCPSSARTDRKLIERNRRNEMKTLLSTLHSLVPNQSSRELEGAKTVPDQLENATNYIKELQTKVEKLKEKREKLLGRGREERIITTSTACSEEIKQRLSLLQLKAHQVGSSMEILLTTGSDYHFVLTQILRLLQQNGAEIFNVNQSMFPDRIFHKIIAQVAEEGSDSERICETVKKFVSQYKDGQYTL